MSLFTGISTPDRITIWNLMADLLESGFEIERALPVIGEVLDGQNRAHQARQVRALGRALQSGTFREALCRTAPGSEAVVFGAWGRADAAAVFRAAARVAGIRRRIIRAVTTSLAMPVLLTVMLILMLWAAGGYMIPELAAFQSPETWPLDARLFESVTVWVHTHPFVVITGAAAVPVLFWWLSRTWTGPGRAWADNWPPFRLVRFLSGAGFIFTVIESVRAGIDLDDRLFRDAARGGTPYEQNRIKAIARAMTRGHGFGAAMKQTGHGYPSPDLIPIIAALERSSGWEQHLASYLDRWINGTEARVEAFMASLNRLVLVVIAGTIALMLSAFFSLISNAVGGPTPGSGFGF